jgi:serine O-acetyltransferase
MSKPFSLSIKSGSLAEYTANQITQFFPDEYDDCIIHLRTIIDDTLDRIFGCFSRINNKYYTDGTNVLFNHLNSDHYSMFLYLLGNTLYRISQEKEDAIRTADKLFLLNKALHGIDAYYRIKLPEVFVFVHPVGTVLGRARYGNYFMVYQNCTIGALEGDTYPEFGDYIIMFSGASIIGTSKVGSNIVFGARSFICNVDVPDDCVVTGMYPNHEFSTNNIHVKNRKFF